MRHIGSFNLVIEILIVDRQGVVELWPELMDCFNLVIEILIVDRRGSRRPTLFPIDVSIS